MEEEVYMHLSVMKSLTADWIKDFYHYKETHPETSINGFNAAGEECACC